MTVNSVPPNSGWKNFRLDMLKAFEALFRSYPLAANYLKLEQLRVGYMDAYLARHGYDGRYGRFISAIKVMVSAVSNEHSLGVCPSNRSAKLLAAKLSRISRHGEDLS